MAVMLCVLLAVCGLAALVSGWLLVEERRAAERLRAVAPARHDRALLAELAAIAPPSLTGAERSSWAREQVERLHDGH